MTNVQVALDIELSQMFKRLREIHGLKSYQTEDWFAHTDMFGDILYALEQENKAPMIIKVQYYPRTIQVGDCSQYSTITTVRVE